jgi:hypothetical protein
VHPFTRRSFLATAAATAAAAPTESQNLIWVMMDGLRWQEVFRGADPLLIHKDNGKVGDVEALRKIYWRDTPQQRRETLQPFVWSVLARQGQIYGNRDAGSEMAVTNGHNFSYPGYSETLCGFADARIDSNDKVNNPNVTVLEWLHQKPAYKGKVAAFGAWGNFPWIINSTRSGIPVNAGHDPMLGAEYATLNRLRAESKIWDDETLDVFTYHSALQYVRRNKPRVLFLGLGEADEWAHAGQYTQYLECVRRADAWIKELWETVQSMPQYRGKTSLLYTCDHGRGEAPVNWKNHGEKTPDSKYTWAAFLGPQVKPLGERAKVAAVEQTQLAATAAALLGEDYRGAVSKAGAPIKGVLT